MAIEERDPQICAAVPRDLKERFAANFPWGTQSAVLRTAIENLCDIAEGPYGNEFLTLFLKGEVSIKDALKHGTPVKGQPSDSPPDNDEG